MAFSLNRAQIIGNLTRDPEMRYTPNGQAVCSFGVATNRRWKDKNTGEQKEETQFHNIVAWGKLAEIVQQILHKGNKVFAEGRLQTRTWEGQDGARRERTEIVMDNFVALTPKGAPIETGAGTSEPVKEAPADKPADKPKTKPTQKTEKEDKKENLEEVNLDDIPF